MKFNHSRIIQGALSLIVLLLAACGGGSGGGGSTADTTAPTVASTSPAKDATGVAVNAAVTVTFSEPIDCASLTTGTFTIGGVTGAVSCTGNSATFTPATSLGSNASYTATVSTGARDVAGNGLAANQVWTFTTNPARVVFADNSNIYSVKEDGNGQVALADSLSLELIPRWCTRYDSGSINGCDPAAYMPMVQNGRAIYQVWSSFPSFGYTPADIYAINLDGSQRVALAATADIESAFALLGDRLVYLAQNTTTFALNVHSVRLDGSGDVALTNETAANSAYPVGIFGNRLVLATAAGTSISDADGNNRITLWNKRAGAVMVTGTQLLLTDYTELVSVKPDGSGLVSLTTNMYGGGTGYSFTNGSLMFGVAGGRVFYDSVISGTTNTYQLNSVALDGSNPLVLGSSTTAFPWVYAVAGTTLISSENNAGTFTIVSYDIAQANSRTPLLANRRFLLLTGNRVLGIAAGAASGTYVVSAVNADGSASIPLTPDIVPVDGSNQLVYLNNNQIVYEHTAASGQIEGYSVALDGNGATQITTGAGDKELMALSGDRLVYQSHTMGDIAAQRDLHSVLLNGTGTLDYATTAADERYMGQFGTNLIYSSTDAGTVAMKLVPVAGGTAVPLQSSANAKSFVGAF